MAKKVVRQNIVFTCTICNNKNYTSTKNTLNSKDKLELNKFCPNCRKHTFHKEGKK